MIFKKDFAWGAATASYQNEGGMNADGKDYRFGMYSPMKRGG